MTHAMYVLHPPSAIHTLKAHIRLRAAMVSVKVTVHRRGLWVPCGFLELEPVEWFTLERTFRAEGIVIEYEPLPTEGPEVTTH